MNFKDFKLKDNILSTLSMEGFFEPTKIQEKFIPLALKNNDILAKSETGSGKTLAYSLPILNNVENDGVQALIVAPTKELVIQIKSVIEKFAKFLNLKICSLYGALYAHSLKKKTTKQRTLFMMSLLSWHRS